ncbi:1-acyl-sn-glycerol-3-phosphate acyltransferase [Alteromonadaceae bacterium Bs31]|nr:1-acyl-sn-glycerol-3-phosphate acyltransferase [Alteromonadaceae bacterium Bs31]
MFIKTRSFLFAVIYNSTGVFYGTLSLFLWPLPLRLRHRVIMGWTQLAVFLARWICGLRYQVIGRENLPAKGETVLILSKHQSTWETLFLQNLFWPACTVLKKELLRIPFFGWGLAALNPIPIDRDNPREALRKVKTNGVQRLQNGYNLLLFPEGTRVAPGEKGKYARSGADIAVESGKNIIPIAVNSGVYWPTKQMEKVPGCITIVVGPPISPEGKTSRELIGEVETWIESTMKTL